MGRPAKPIQLHIHDGKTHLTKAQIRERLASQITFGGAALRVPAHIKKNKVAFAKWKELIKLYDGMDFVSAGDVGIISMYCQTYSEYMELLQVRHEIQEKGYDAIKTLALCNKLNIEGMLNKKNELLRGFEDRLFLNPLAKVKNVRKAADKKEPDFLEAAGFDSV